MGKELITENDIANLERQIQAAKSREKRHKLLQQQLEAINIKVDNFEYNGSLQEQDTAKKLHTKRTNPSLFEIMITRFSRMMSMKPINGNIIAILLGVVAIVLLYVEVKHPFVIANQAWFILGIKLLLARQVLLSASRSLLLPIAALLVALLASSTIGELLVVYLGNNIMQELLVVGILGLMISIFTMD